MDVVGDPSSRALLGTRRDDVRRHLRLLSLSLLDVVVCAMGFVDRHERVRTDKSLTLNNLKLSTFSGRERKLLKSFAKEDHFSKQNKHKECVARLRPQPAPALRSVSSTRVARCALCCIVADFHFLYNDGWKCFGKTNNLSLARRGVAPNKTSSSLRPGSCYPSPIATPPVCPFRRHTGRFSHPTHPRVPASIATSPVGRFLRCHWRQQAVNTHPCPNRSRADGPTLKLPSALNQPHEYSSLYPTGSRAP